FFLIFTSLFLSPLLAQDARAERSHDASVQGQLRSYPWGGTLDLEVGSALHLWGSKKTPTLGFARGFLGSSHAGTYNSGVVGVEFFPLGFLGVKAGYELANNETDYQSLDCESYRCKGTWERRFI